MRLWIVGALTAWSAARVRGASSIGGGDPVYVVQLHSSRDGFVPPANAEQVLRTQLMTTESGQHFECFLPYTPQQKKRALEREQVDAAQDPTDHSQQQFLAFTRAAAKKVRPKCLQYVDEQEKWVYEICPGVLVRKISLTAQSNDADHPEDTADATAQSEIHELAAFATDVAEEAAPYEEFLRGDIQDRIASQSKLLYTQVFHPSAASEAQGADIKLQFVCSPTARDDVVGGVEWRRLQQLGGSPKQFKEPAAFVIMSRVFCDPKHSDTSEDDEAFTVGSLLRPLADLRTCIKRNEGWWTYEFCFGDGIRQYHRDSDGAVAAEFSLGMYDMEQNKELEASGAALVSEHIDATHDVSRPAFVEIYSGGTHCKEFDVSTPRKSKVFYYCSQGGMNHHILAVKETQTCTYTIKISSPVVCDHPHFIHEEQASEDKAEIVHCIPVVADTEAAASSDATVQAKTLDRDSFPVREVEVTAT